MSVRNTFLALCLIATSFPVLAGSAAEDVKLISPFARAVPKGLNNGAMFVTLDNQGNTDRALVSASSNVSDIVELHEHANIDGMMKMRRIDKIDIPAGSQTELKPGGLHIMFIGLKDAIPENSQVTVTLTFDDNSSTRIDVPVKAMGAMSMGHKGMHHGGKKNNMAMMLHANPMPNLMKVVKKHENKLNLSSDQSNALKQWRDNNHQPMHDMVAELHSLEKSIYDAAMKGDSIESIISMANKASDLRVRVITQKAECRDNMQKVLNKEQYAMVLNLYREHFEK